LRRHFARGIASVWTRDFDPYHHSSKFTVDDPDPDASEESEPESSGSDSPEGDDSEEEDEEDGHQRADGPPIAGTAESRIESDFE
jgi:hypothetical protein